MSPRRLRHKRAFDIATTLGMAWFWAPILGTMMLLVLVLDGRPVFFLQERAGRGRSPFRIYKLRTMTTDHDVRQRKPTRFGRFLRDRGFDELPQVLNVLEGTMSLVGPRPLTAADAERLVEVHPPFEARFAVPPGLTGLAQVCLARGSEQTAALDAAYAAERTHWLDTRILFRTVFINLVGKRRGARPITRELRT
jgi:lipopolysaccharide/colanic/teichoic acid biosynthesis glycosyltransferase